MNLNREKDPSERESHSGWLALLVDDVLAFEFDEIVCEILDSHEEFNEFLDGLRLQYQEESKSEIGHPATL